MPPYLAFITAPLVGAIIGYVTNALAIRMLFRPLKEIRIWGIKLPFTPGILPRERGRLAASIGTMVERELLDPQTLLERLDKGEVRKDVARAAENLVRQKGAAFLSDAVMELMLLLSEPGVKSALENRGRDFLLKAIDKLPAIQRLFISAARYDKTISEKMPEIIDDLLRELESALRSPAFLEKAPVFAAERLRDALLYGSISREQIKSLLDSVDIKTLVEDRINSLEMIRVEKIILDVMADQFTWINIFGAILGAIIGVFQAFLVRI